MKVNVIKDRCIACGQCVGINDKIFDFGEDGLAEAIVDKVEKDMEEDAQIAAEACPTGAIEVE